MDRQLLCGWLQRVQYGDRDNDGRTTQQQEGKVHSGSPFFQLLNDGDFKRRNGKFCEFACQVGPAYAEE